MARRPTHAKLSLDDAVDLRNALTKLDAIHDSVQATGMAGKAAIMALCVELYRLVERLLAKEYRAVGASLGVAVEQTPLPGELDADPVQQAPDAPQTPPAGGKVE